MSSPRSLRGAPGRALAALGLALTLVFAGPLALVGCGYSLGGYKPPPSVRTIAVPIFDNATFPLRREIEYELTGAVRREILARTDLAIVGQERADMVLYGKIVSFFEDVIAEGPLDEEEEANIRVTVELVVEDLVNRKTWSTTVRDTEPFSVARGETIGLARGRAIDNLAEKILLSIETW